MRMVPGADANAVPSASGFAPNIYTCANDNAGILPVKAGMRRCGGAYCFEIYLFPNRKAIAIRAMAMN